MHDSAGRDTVEKLPPRGLEPLSENAQPVVTTGLTQDDESVLAPCLALSVQNDPDLRAVVTAWPELPEAIRVGIVAMVQAATETGCTEAQPSAKRE